MTGVLLDTAADPPRLVSQQSWALQQGERAPAYAVIFEQVRDYLQAEQVAQVFVKASATSRSMTSKHLESAELRGVVIAAAANAGVPVNLVAKAGISRNFGERSADEYISDDGFWEQQIDGDLPKTRREAALLIISSRQ